MAGFCVSSFPKHPQCSEIVEPADLLDSPLAGPDAPLVIGSIFSLAEPKDRVLTESVRLAVDEINNKGGKLNRGKRLGLVVCDNGGPVNTPVEAERDTLTNAAVDYLAGTLGVPYIVGPLSSSDSLRVIARLREKKYPTVVISPSATSPALTNADDSLVDGGPGLFWRTCPSDVLQGSVMATDVIGMDPAITKVAVIYSNDAYGLGLSDVFRKNYGEMKSSIFPINDVQFEDPAALASVASQVATYAPDAVLIITVRAGNTIKVMDALVGTPAQNAKFFVTDGAKDADALFDPALRPEVAAIIANTVGTAPASPSGLVYDSFRANLNAKFMRDASAFSFTAQAYDATYVGAYGVIWASRENDAYDGRQVSEGMGRLSNAMGAAIDINVIDWASGKTSLVNGDFINITGASGLLDFDATTGEAPGKIEIWNTVGGTLNTL